MGTVARIALRGAIIVGLTGAGCTNSPSSPNGTALPSTVETANPSGSPADLTLTETFTSTLHGYSVRYPAGWSATAATAVWEVGASGNVWGSAALDDIHGSTVRFVAASQQLANGQTADAWLAAYASQGACEGSDPSQWPSIPVGDRDGVMSADGCPALGGTIAPGGRLFDVVVFVGPRAYDFTVDGTTDHAFVEAILATVLFASE